MWAKEFKKREEAEKRETKRIFQVPRAVGTTTMKTSWLTENGIVGVTLFRQRKITTELFWHKKRHAMSYTI